MSSRGKYVAQPRTYVKRKKRKLSSAIYLVSFCREIAHKLKEKKEKKKKLTRNASENPRNGGEIKLKIVSLQRVAFLYTQLYIGISYKLNASGAWLGLAARKMRSRNI